MEDYALGELLGKGAAGTVHVVTRRSDGAQLALKRQEFAGTSHAVQKASLAEVRLLRQLQHPNIIAYHDAFVEGGVLHIVMERAAGSLEEELKAAQASGCPIPEEQLLSILGAVGRALHVMHGCRVLHRDLKPANVLLAEDGSPKLADLGISASIVSHRAQLGRALRRGESDDAWADEARGALVGTPYYMAPELFQDTAYTPASDVWALGVTMYELLCARRPYQGSNMSSLALAIAADVAQNAMRDASAQIQAGGELGARLGGYSAELRACVEGMLHKKPPQRATLSELLSREVLVRHARGGGGEAAAPVDLLAEKQALLDAPVPDLFGFGRGAAVPRLREDMLGVRIISLACGAAHCAAVSDAGEVFTWGANEHGQLGHGDRHRLSRRRAVLALEAARVQSVACGRSHTVAMTAGGLMYAWGCDEMGQLGLDRGGEAGGGGEGGEDGGALAGAGGSEDGAALHDGMGCVLVPARLPPAPPPERWTAVACGEAHCVALSSDGAAHGWGCADDGRLGLGPQEAGDCVRAPSRMPRPAEGGGGSGGDRLPRELPPLRSVACGDDFTVCLDAEGGAYGCGANYACQLGLDPELELEEALELTPLLRGVDGLGAVGGLTSLSCGGDHAAAIDGGGGLWVWGGRFGDAPARVELPRRAPDAVGSDGCVLVACGAGVVVAVGEEGGAFAWGEGEHGRLGLGDGGRDHTSPQRLDALSTPALRVQAAACGRGVGSLDEGPAVLVLASSPDEA